MRTVGTLVYIDQCLFIRSVTTEWAEPYRVATHWRVSRYTVSPYGIDKSLEDILCGVELWSDVGDGFFTGAGWTFFLVDGAKTKGEYIERTPIPPPRTKRPTRWRDGRWERYLKRGGWVAAG